MNAGSTPATPVATIRASGSAPSSLRRLDRDDLLGEPPLVAGCDRAPVAGERELVLILARDRVAFGDVLGRLAHRLGRVELGPPRVDQPPAERGVIHRLLAAREGRGGLRHHPGGPAHRLRATGQIELALAEPERSRRLVHGLEPRGAEAVDRHPRDFHRQPGQQRGHAGDVAVVLPGLVRGAPVDVADLRRIDPRARHRRRDRMGGEVVRPHAGEGAPVAAHRRAHGVDDQRLGHRPAMISRRRRCSALRGGQAAEGGLR